MAEDRTGFRHDTSDQKLDQAAEAEQDAIDAKEASGPRYDPEEIRKHDDAGKHRLLEGRQQHDEADKNSEKTRLARDVARHDHPVDDNIADSGTGPSAKRKS